MPVAGKITDRWKLTGHRFRKHGGTLVEELLVWRSWYLAGRQACVKRAGAKQSHRANGAEERDYEVEAAEISHCAQIEEETHWGQRQCWGGKLDTAGPRQLQRNCTRPKRGGSCKERGVKREE